MKLVSILSRSLKALMLIFGVVFFILILLSFTSIPYTAYRALSLYDQQISGDPEYIVLMGGSGIPSPTDLMRLYYATLAARECPGAKIIIAIPYHGSDSVAKQAVLVEKMSREGVDANRIIWASSGHNTRSQVVEISGLISLSSPIVVVSSPDHMYRSVRSFEKVGFQTVGSLPAFENPPDEKELLSKKDPGITELQNLNLRYNVWSYLQYEIIVLREYAAIVYYRLKGWV